MCIFTHGAYPRIETRELATEPYRHVEVDEAVVARHAMPAAAAAFDSFAAARAAPRAQPQRQPHPLSAPPRPGECVGLRYATHASIAGMGRLTAT